MTPDVRLINPYALAAAENGAAHLDQTQPGWFDRVDLDTLEMGDGENDSGTAQGCVVCQVTRLNYGEGLDLLGVSLNNDADYGFNTGYKFGYSDLDVAWRQIIRERRGESE